MKLRLVAASASTLGLALAAIAFGGGGCEAGLVHTFGAYPFNAAVGCLNSAVGVDVIDGPDPGTCAVVHCWVAPSGDVYISDQACDAPLDYKESTSGPCAQALTAYKKNIQCASNGTTDAGDGS